MAKNIFSKTHFLCGKATFLTFIHERCILKLTCSALERLDFQVGSSPTLQPYLPLQLISSGSFVSVMYVARRHVFSIDYVPWALSRLLKINTEPRTWTISYVQVRRACERGANLGY